MKQETGSKIYKREVSNQISDEILQIVNTSFPIFRIFAFVMSRDLGFYMMSFGLNIDTKSNFVSFSLGFVSQATKHQSVQPILFYSFPIMFTLLLSAK